MKRFYLLIISLTGLAITTFAQPVENLAFSDYVESVKVNGIELALEKGNGETLQQDTYYCPLPQTVYDDPGRSFIGKWEIVFKNGTTEYDSFEIVDYATSEDGNVIIPNINDNNEYTYSIRIFNSQNEESDGLTATVNFTFLPVVEVSVEMENVNADKYVLGQMRVIDPDYSSHEGAVSANDTVYARFKYRGNASLAYDKKNFAVKTCDENEDGVDRSFFGFRDDNNWIIEACAADPTLMRNRVSTDIWNDFSTKPYYVRDGNESEDEAHSGTRGRFVEVLVNGSYHGLFTFTEKTDRKQLKLKKLKDDVEIRGLLYKSGSYGIEGLMGYDKTNHTFGNAAQQYDNYNKEEVWAGYEIKYPDYEEEPIDWKPLYDAINFVSQSSDEEFASHIEEYFDRPVMDDYYLLLEIIKAYDNVGNNIFYYIYNIQDSKLMGIAPWDMDTSFGNGAESVQAPDESLKHLLEVTTDNKFQLFYRMARRADIDWHEDLGARYRLLRNYEFGTEALKNRFVNYYDLISASRADIREEQKWPQYHPDIKEHVDYICNFIERRMAFLDEYYAETQTGINAEEAGSSDLEITGGTGRITVTANTDKSLHVYSISGNQIGIIQTVDGKGSVSGLQPGIYIVGNHKVAVF